MRARRLLLSALLLLAFALGGGQYMPQPAAAAILGQTDHAMLADMATPDHPMADDCAMCTKQDSGKPLCLPACVGIQVIMPEAPALLIDVTMARLGLAAEERMNGPAVGPDPPPPRPSILS